MSLLTLGNVSIVVGTGAAVGGAVNVAASTNTSKPLDVYSAAVQEGGAVASTELTIADKLGSAAIPEAAAVSIFANSVAL